MADGTVGPDDYSVSVIRIPDGVRNWDLVRSYLELRKRVFIERMCWRLYQDRGLEYEQYDTMDTVYVVAHRGRHAVGGARLRRTDRSHTTGRHGYSYMIRDACRGLLPALPSNLCFTDPPVDASVWELTRLTATSDQRVNRSVLQAANAFLFQQAAKSCLFLGPPAFLRMARTMGWQPEPLGPVVGNQDGRFLAFQCGVLPLDQAA